MTIIEHIKESVQAIGCAFIYDARGVANEIIATTPEFADEPPVVLCYLLTSGTTEQVGGAWRERVQVALFFSKLAEIDFDGQENEETIDLCKRYAQRWLQSLCGGGVQSLRLVSVNGTERVYQQQADLLTAYGINVTIEEVEGTTPCQ